MIEEIYAIEAYNSRGVPTIGVKITLNSGAHGLAYAPGGASVGKREAINVVDADPAKWHGKGVSGPVSLINSDIREAFVGRSFSSVREFDQLLLELDPSEQKEKIGGNVVTVLSIAFARALAQDKQIPLYKLIMEEMGINTHTSPVPMMNVINGGAHANNSLDIQEFMIAPHGVNRFSEKLRACSEIYWTLHKRIDQLGLSTGVGDEGGFAPSLQGGTQTAIELLIESIEKSGYLVGEDVSLTLDCAASEYFADGHYHLKGEELKLNSVDYTNWISTLVNDYPISSIEDPADEDDWETWSKITNQIGADTQVVGDDIFVTQRKLLERGIAEKSANAILIKINQTGSITETLDVIALAKDNNFGTIVSHRSGDTEDTFVADLAVGTNAKQIKTGAPCRSERVAKYNRLLWIVKEQAT